MQLSIYVPGPLGKELQELSNSQDLILQALSYTYSIFSKYESFISSCQRRKAMVKLLIFNYLAILKLPAKTIIRMEWITNDRLRIKQTW